MSDSDSPVSELDVKLEVQKKPKRKCSQKQLAALAAGRAKNKHFKPKKEEKKEEKTEKGHKVEKKNV